MYNIYMFLVIVIKLVSSSSGPASAICSLVTTAFFSIQFIAYWEGSTDTDGMRGRLGRVSHWSADVRSGVSPVSRVLASGSSHPENSSACLMARSRVLLSLTCLFRAPVAHSAEEVVPAECSKQRQTTVTGVWFQMQHLPLHHPTQPW